MTDRVRGRARRARLVRAGAALAVVLTAVVPVVPAAASGPDLQEPCLNVDAAGIVEGSGDIPWAQERLDFDRAQRFATGRGVTVAVVDSGIDASQPQTKGIDVREPVSALALGAPALGYQPTDVRDCDREGHGTGVAAIIAGQAAPDVGFVGLAPDATVMPIKWFDPDEQDIDPDVIAAGIQAAVDSPLGVDVINLSLSVQVDDADIRAAVRNAGRADIVVVAAAGNDGENSNVPSFPAEYAGEDDEEFAHVLSVGAIADTDDAISDTSTSGAYLGVVAPGEGVMAPTSLQGYRLYSGTSFAAPFVSATAALVRERYPGMSAAKVVNRLKATADRPGRSVPDVEYGYGVVNPYLAVTAARDDSTLERPTRPMPAVAAPVLPEPPDRTLQNIAYAVTAGLLGLAGVCAVGSMAWRRTAAERRRMTAQAG